MGVVYLARDPLIGRDVAIKVLRSLDEADLRARFAREVQIAGALAHPNIVRIYDAGEFDEQPFVAMEYVSGPTLDHYIKSGTPVSLDRKLELLADLADGLAHAHARKVVHRDIKPSNLIIDEHDRLKILDFGIARFAASGQCEPRGRGHAELHGAGADSGRGIGRALRHLRGGRGGLRAVRVSEAVRRREPPRPAAAHSE